MLIENKNILLKFKRNICIFFATITSNLYKRFRNCSGVAQQTEKKLKEYKENKIKIKTVERKLPVIKEKVDLIQAENKHLKTSLNVCIDDLEFIYISLLKNDIDSAIKLLEEYPFSKKIKKD